MTLNEADVPLRSRSIPVACAAYRFLELFKLPQIMTGNLLPFALNVVVSWITKTSYVPRSKYKTFYLLTWMGSHSYRNRWN